MNLSKSILACFLLSILIVSSSALAAAPAPTPVKTVQVTEKKAPAPANSVLVASVDLRDAKIVSQTKGELNVSFSLYNRGSLQTGIKYGLQLVSDGTNKYVADEKVYDDSVTLAEGQTVVKNVIFKVNNMLSGSYTLMLGVENESGMPFGFANLGNIKLTSAVKGVNISVDSCYMKVVGDKTDKHYTLIQNVDISKDESLSINCTATNGSASTLTMYPFYESRYMTSYGALAKQTGGDYNPITFKNGEKKSFSVVIPKVDLAKFYSVKFQLMSGDNISNPIYAKYILRGVSATIYKISLDKDYYKVGDKAELSVIWSGPSSKFNRGGNVSGTIPKINFKATITDEKGNDCVAPIEQALVKDPKSVEAKIPFTFKSSCLNPKVKATLSDESGNVLDQKEYVFNTGKGEEMAAKDTKTTVMILIALLAILGLGLYMKRKNANNS